MTTAVKSAIARSGYNSITKSHQAIQTRKKQREELLQAGSKDNSSLGYAVAASPQPFTTMWDRGPIIPMTGADWSEASDAAVEGPN